MADKMSIEEFRKNFAIDRDARGLKAVDLSGQPKGKRHKYKAQKTVENGIVFDSKREATRYLQLKMLENAGVITDLESNAERIKLKKKKIRYELKKRNGNICHYEPDFTYYEKGEFCVEDAKGFKTPIYIQKKKLMLKQYGIEIKET